MNTHVSFEIAKLLKEKGYDSKKPIAEYWSIEEKQYLMETWEEEYDSFHHEDCPDDIVFLCSAPTIADVVMWLYEKHGIWVITVPQGLSTTWVFSLFNVEPEKGRIIFDSPSFNSLTEAYEAAITYILNNLI